ncbi:lysylphosphatidylglycerol synthase transmembrane domain-containing protein [Actinoallomurus bryophytorum]|uniref:lysylphosphatidylglycerol synthase transmembrane domain-containing protein n=1 Tax=Actinoallomurus bryophytorum TaxID=1490222 RepID=UPI001C8A4C0E|nr:lysylphosphatidylglycerol synthase transmembrane domain-containing protein [Actinoallomurus bryophytorum]
MRSLTRAVWPWLRLLIGAGILAVLLWRLGTDAFLNGLRVIDAPAVLAALVIGLVTTVAGAARWCLVLRRLGVGLPLRTAVADCYRAVFLNTVLPGGVLGDVHRAVRHGQSSGDVARGVRAVAIERSGGQVVLTAAGVAVLWARPSIVAAAGRHLVAPVPVAVACALVLAVVAVIRWGRHTAVWRRVAAPVLTDVRRGLLARDTWPGVMALSVAGLLGHVTLFLIAARVAGSSAPVSQLLPLIVLALFAMGLPVNIGGWGPREGVSAWAFAAAGLGAAEGVTVAVVYGVLAFVTGLPGAGVLIFGNLARPEVQLEEKVLTEYEAPRRCA